MSVLARVSASTFLGAELVSLPGTADQLSYHTLAERLIDGHGFTFGTTWWPATAAGSQTGMWSYLYVLYLTMTYAIAGVNPLAPRLIQAIAVGVLHPLMSFLIGRRLYGSGVGIVAAAVSSVYAYFVYYSATLMTESFYITAILASLYLAIRLVDVAIAGRSDFELRGRALALGLSLGAAVLLRQVFLLFVPVLLIWVWWANGRRISTAFLPAVVVAALILPFTMYNYARFGRFVLLNTNTGYAFFWANHPIY